MSQENREYTVKTFSDKLGLAEDKGRGLLYFLEAVGLADNLGSRKVEKQKGKGPNYYVIKPEASKKIASMLEVL